MNRDNFKFISRVVHMTSVMAMSGLVTYNYFSDGELVETIREHASYKDFNTVTGLLLFVSGIANVFLVKAKKLEDPVHKVWQHFFELKLVVSVLLTPMIYPLTAYFAPEGQNTISESKKTEV